MKYRPRKHKTTDCHNQCRGGGSIKDHQQFVKAGKLPHGRIEPKDGETDNKNSGNPRNPCAEGFPVVATGENPPVITQYKRNPVAEKDTENIYYDLNK